MGGEIGVWSPVASAKDDCVVDETVEIMGEARVVAVEVGQVDAIIGIV